MKTRVCLENCDHTYKSYMMNCTTLAKINQIVELQHEFANDCESVRSDAVQSSKEICTLKVLRGDHNFGTRRHIVHNNANGHQFDWKSNATLGADTAAMSWMSKFVINCESNWRQSHLARTTERSIRCSPPSSLATHRRQCRLGALAWRLVGGGGGGGVDGATTHRNTRVGLFQRWRPREYKLQR